MRFTVRSGCFAVVGALLASVALVSQPASAAPVEPLLADHIDRYADYDGADTCSPSPKPGAVALLDLLSTAYPGTGGYIGRDCGGSPPTSEHNEGRAVDWMVSADTERDLADDFFAWVFASDAYGNSDAMVRRLGIMYMIWDHRIWRAYDADEGWQPYDGPNPHTDHVHISMSWDGAMQRTTWTTGAEEGLLLDQARFAATWRGEKRLDVFRRSETGALEQKTWAGSWSGWTGLGGDLTSGPAAVWQTRKKLWVFAQGPGETLVQRRWRDGKSWGDWKDTGVPISAAPGVTENDGRLDLFVRTPSGALSHRTWLPKRDRGNVENGAERSGAGWSRWEDLGGILSAPPTAAWTTPKQLEVFVRGTTGMLHQKTYAGSAWTDWVGLGGVLTSGPAAVSMERREVNVYVRTERGSVSEKTYADGWSGWVDLGGTHVSAVAAAGLQHKRRDLFTRDRGGGLAQNYLVDGRGWSGWALR